MCKDDLSAIVSYRPYQNHNNKYIAGTALLDSSNFVYLANIATSPYYWIILFHHSFNSPPSVDNAAPLNAWGYQDAQGA